MLLSLHHSRSCALESKEKASTEVGDGNADNNINGDPGGSNLNHNTHGDDDVGMASMTTATTVGNIGASSFRTPSPAQVCLPPRFSSHSDGPTSITGASSSTLPVGTSSESACAARGGLKLGGETSPSTPPVLDEWSQAVARRAQDKGKGMACS